MDLQNTTKNLPRAWVVYKLKITRYKDEAVMDKAVASADARIKTDLFQGYVSHYTPSLQQQGYLSSRF